MQDLEGLNKDMDLYSENSEESLMDFMQEDAML